MATWAIVAGRRAPIEGLAPPLIVALVLANLVPIVGLVLLIARRIALLRADRRQGIAGSQLHTRLVVLFATMAAAPTVLVAVFAAVLFQFGVQFWFSDRAKTVLDNADRVAQTYVEDNKRRILDDIIATGVDLRSYAIDLGGLRSPTFRQGLQFQVASRNLSEAAVFGVRNGEIVPIAEIGLDARSFTQRMATLDLARVRVGEAQVVASAGDRVEAVVRIDPLSPVYVYVSRRVDPRVLDQVTRTQTALSEYKALTERSRALQWRFAMALLVLSLLVIALAVWFALWVANRLVAPVGRLAQAAESVGAGDFTVRVPVRNANDELGTMARAFNRMTGQIQAQQNALVAANAAADGRRRFIEAVLSGVSAGVLSIDGEGVVRLANESALALLAEGREGLVGRRLAESVPELAGLLDAARTDGLAAAQVELTRGGAALTLAVRLAAEAGTARSYILTFDDISQQLRDQRTAAWSDVARASLTRSRTRSRPFSWRQSVSPAATVARSLTGRIRSAN
jgi:two-component system nitrogen regulation sensor histidine kinase NtrY